MYKNIYMIDFEIERKYKKSDVGVQWTIIRVAELRSSNKKYRRIELKFPMKGLFSICET